MKLRVKKSPIHGKGLFAAQDIPWGMKIIEYKGEIVSDAVAEARIAAGADAVFELRDDLNIDGAANGNEARYANHSRRKPNCFVLRDDGRIWLVDLFGRRYPRAPAASRAVRHAPAGAAPADR